MLFYSPFMLHEYSVNVFGFLNIARKQIFVYQIFLDIAFNLYPLGINKFFGNVIVFIE